MTDYEDSALSTFRQVYPKEIKVLPYYFENIWTGRITKRRDHSDPIFRIVLWNVHISVVEDMPKTDNVIE